MPSLPDDEGRDNHGNTSETTYFPLKNVVYLMTRTSMGWEQIMKLPYPIFLYCLKEIYLMEMMQIPEFSEKLVRAERLKRKEPDYEKLRRLPGYKEKGGE